MIPLVIAAHGTRDADGEAACRALVARVAAQLAPIPVSVGFVELNEPPIPAALQAALQDQESPGTAVVVPLMLGSGGHVQRDIPEAIAAAEGALPDAAIRYTGYLGADPRLVGALAARLEAAAAGWDRRDTHVVLLGRGTLVPEANADHARLARLLFERCGVAEVAPAFVQVTRPGLPEALNRLYAQGARRIVVAPNFLFPGRLATWTREQLGAWSATHRDADVRQAAIIGDCDELAAVVVDRYRVATATASPDDGSPAYLAGLLLRDRPVVMVGAGHVSDRRVERFLEAGARVRLVSPTLSIKLRHLVEAGDIEHVATAFDPSHLDDAWFVCANTNDPEVNSRVAACAEERHLFCVRADDARHGTAWTPATERVAGMSVATLGCRQPELSRRVRDAVVRELLG